MEGEVGPRALAKATRRLIPYLFGIYSSRISTA